MFAEGAFNAAFVPTFSSILKQENKRKALEFASQVFSNLFFILLIIILIIDYLFNLLKSKVLHLFTNHDCGVRIVMVLKGFFEKGIITSFS